ncbi:MAG: TlpA family protein disulfide reductase [Calditrichaeota bacterium]|nr:TlpA family protein disulfide reductase [Calditrichota bacterium]
MKKQRLFSFLTIFALAAALAVGCSKSNEQANAEPAAKGGGEAVQTATSTTSGPVAPDFQLRGVDGKIHKLSDYKGKVIILDFWDTWCPPCRMEIPDFVKLQEQYGKKGLQIIGVAFGRQGLDAVKNFMEQYHINYPVLLATMEVVQAYGGIQGIPTTFVIDKHGRIYQKYVGYRPRSVWESDIQTLLAQK